MLDEATKNAVADYVLDQYDRERIKLFVDIYDSRETIRLRVINKFAEQLTGALSDALPVSDGWKVDADELLANPLERYSSLNVRRSTWTWDKEAYVSIEAQSVGAGDWVVGVRAMQNRDRLRAAAIERWGQGKISNGWPWYRSLGHGSEFGSSELGDWRTGAAILALAEGSRGVYGKRLCDRIVEMSKTVDSVPST